MKVKRGVSLRGIKWQIFLACIVAESVYNRSGYELIITSGSEGIHKFDTHADGWGVDWRTQFVPPIPVDVQKAIVKQIQDELGSEYDVILESDHIHCEYDPRITKGGVV